MLIILLRCSPAHFSLPEVWGFRSQQAQLGYRGHVNDRERAPLASEAGDSRGKEGEGLIEREQLLIERTSLKSDQGAREVGQVLGWGA
jgi:hypothetical protein